MFKIVSKRALNDAVSLMEIEAPLIAAKGKAGQFIILRVNETGERIPLTLADEDPERGTITIMYQKVGKTTLLLDTLAVGDAVFDVVGPLGNATELEGYRKAVVIGGGVGCAIAYPEAKALHRLGAHVDMIAGFRNRDIIMLEEELDEIGLVLNKDAIEKLKKKKKKRLERQQRQSFEERVRCDVETINRTIAVGKLYKAKERQRIDKDLIQTREEREKNGGQKDKERDKRKEDRTRSGGGRSRDLR